MQLDSMLSYLFNGAPYHLDHNPPLMLRKQIRNRAGDIIGYKPDANDPDFLIYRKADEHKIKTYVRGDGAQRSDAGQRRYLKRVAQNRGLVKKNPARKIKARKQKWPKRKWGKRC